MSDPTPEQRRFISEYVIFLQAGILEVCVHTIDSMQGGEAEMVIFDFFQ